MALQLERVTGMKNKTLQQPGMDTDQDSDGAPETKPESIMISSPFSGYADELKNAPDEVFAAGTMGLGAVVTPTEKNVRAPEDGEVSFVSENGQEIGFRTDSGIELVIHIGMDTVKLNGKGFEVLVESGQKLKKRTTMVKLDLGYLKENAASLVSPVLCQNLAPGQTVRLMRSGRIRAGEALFEIHAEDRKTETETEETETTEKKTTEKKTTET